MISFYLGVAARRPFLNQSTSRVSAANSSGTLLHVCLACGHMPNIKLSGFNPSHMSFHASPFHCLPPLLPYVVAWLLPLPGMRCVMCSLPIGRHHSCHASRATCLAFPSPWHGSLCRTRTLLLVHLVFMRRRTVRSTVQLFFSALYVLLHRCLHPACIQQE
jgi:hypothetical protein